MSALFIFLIQFFRELFKIYSFFLHSSPCKIRYTITRVKKTNGLKTKPNSWPAARPESSGFKSGRQIIRSFRFIRMRLDIHFFACFISFYPFYNRNPAGFHWPAGFLCISKENPPCNGTADSILFMQPDAPCGSPGSVFQRAPVQSAGAP